MPASNQVFILDPITAKRILPGGAQDATTNASYAAIVPSSQATAAPTSTQTAVAAGSLIVKASAGNLYGYDCCAGASAGYLMVFDSAAAPADGTVTPKRVHAIAANASLSRSFNPPIRCAAGIVLVFSTTGAFTKTISATAFLAGDYA